MGGNALKVPTRRYEVSEFVVVVNELVEALNKHFDKVAVPLYYRNKSSFGDADIIVSNDGKFSVRTYIEENFKPQEIFHNGNCWSFDYKELQVDLIVVASKDFDANYVYLGYNDLGNYIGRIAHGLGFKFGQEGLWYEHYFKGINLGKIKISTDFPKVFDFLGLSYDRWLEGFDELQDIFEYISECKYFNWKMFQLDSLNKINRDRNKKRKSYMVFVDWMNENVADEQHEFVAQDDLSVRLSEANLLFPDAGLFTEIRRLEYEHCRKLYLQAKFNGGDVMRKYGFKGKELGDKFIGFKQWVLGPFDEYILRTDVEDIYKEFDRFLKYTDNTTDDLHWNL